jgi:hypothetical protein
MFLLKELKKFSTMSPFNLESSELNPLFLNPKLTSPKMLMFITAKLPYIPLDYPLKEAISPLIPNLSMPQDSLEPLNNNKLKENLQMLPNNEFDS